MNKELNNSSSKTYEKILDSLQFETKQTNKFRFKLKYVAIFLLFVSSGFLIYYFFKTNFNNEKNFVIANSIDEKVNIIAEKYSRIQLPDSSIVWMNTGSKITYTANFSDSIRKVNLVGEARFQVVHNANKPFEVHHNKMTTKVLGTDFTIINFNAKENDSIILHTGKIEIYFKNKKLTTLHTEQQFIFNQEKERIISTEIKSKKALISKIENTHAFKKKITISFNNIPINEALVILKQKYNIEINSKNVVLDDSLLISLKYNHATLENILNDLQKLGNFSSYQEDNKIFLQSY